MKVLSEKGENILFYLFLICLVASIVSHFVYGDAPMGGLTFGLWIATGINYMLRKLFT